MTPRVALTRAAALVLAASSSAAAPRPRGRRQSHPHRPSTLTSHPTGRGSSFAPRGRGHPGDERERHAQATRQSRRRCTGRLGARTGHRVRCLVHNGTTGLCGVRGDGTGL